MIEETIQSSIREIANTTIDQIKTKQALLNQKELAEYLNRDVKTLKKYYIYEPDFPVIQEGNKVVYPKLGVDEWIANHTQLHREI